MSPVGGECVVFGAEQLLPEAWRKLALAGPVRTFNPGLVCDGDGWLFAYRIVAVDGLRRIGLCRLDRALQVIEGTQVAWSDHVQFRADGIYPEQGTRWFADPRLYRIDDQLFIYWNSGWHEPRNCQFVQELDRTTLLPLDHPRELLLRGERQKLEKNWTFFGTADEPRKAVYTINPHRVLAFSMQGKGDICFDEVAAVNWSIDEYPAHHGGLRGGAPPVLSAGEYWSFCHSVHSDPAGYRYAAAAYTFAPAWPFTPTSRPTRPLQLGNPFGLQRRFERLNTAVGEVIYPCGAARDGARWLVSHGINDEYCAISLVEHDAVLATLQPVGAAS